jgi:hypothetical protein
MAGRLVACSVRRAETALESRGENLEEAFASGEVLERVPAEVERFGTRVNDDISGGL